MSHEPRHTILLIEDDASLRRLITLGLHYRGIQVIEASSPTLLSVFPAKQVELLVLDVNRGAHSNWSLLTAIQSNPFFSLLPMVILAWEDIALEEMQAPGSRKGPTTHPPLPVPQTGFPLPLHLCAWTKDVDRVVCRNSIGRSRNRHWLVELAEIDSCIVARCYARWQTGRWRSARSRRPQTTYESTQIYAQIELFIDMVYIGGGLVYPDVYTGLV